MQRSWRTGCWLAFLCSLFSLSHQQRLVSTRLEYKDPFAGRAAEIAISYTPMEPISDGEVIKIVLQQFTGENGYVEVNSSSAFLYSASW